MQGCRPLTPEEIDEILVSFGGRFAVRDKALFVMGIYTGFRITELLSLRIRDVCQFGRVLPRVTVWPFLHIPPKRYIPSQTAKVERMGTRVNSRTIASKSMISGAFLNS